MAELTAEDLADYLDETIDPRVALCVLNAREMGVGILENRIGYIEQREPTLDSDGSDHANVR